MGIYLNPGNAAFSEAVHSQIYVDKTELISYTNNVLATNQKNICVSRPRRFGKSITANMLAAYYSKGCQSDTLFKDRKISCSKDYKKYLNTYTTIFLNIQEFLSRSSNVEELIQRIRRSLMREIRREYPTIDFYDELDLTENMKEIYAETNEPFIIIIDEWDCVVRNSTDQDLIHQYLQFLHSLFKSEESKSFLALGYITGIMPIKKIKDESALNNFEEYTMLKSRPITKYYGFTEEEVKDLCKRYDMDFETTKEWYNGYLIDGMHMYNPNSVSQAMKYHDFDSYWRNTSAFGTINNFIMMNYSGLKEDVLTMLSGGKVMVDTECFQNDLAEIHSKDDALTALIHLGYLGYDADILSAYIPNYEVAKAFQSALKTGEWKDVAASISKCDTLLMATISGNTEKVAELIELAHDTYTSILKYNDENSLSCVLTMAYFTAPAYYTIIREMPAGKGFADFVFLPRVNAGNRPAMIVELKYNQSADTVIRQIKEKRYQGALSGYESKILLVGISYDSEKHHTCSIEEW